MCLIPLHTLQTCSFTTTVLLMKRSEIYIILCKLKSAMCSERSAFLSAPTAVPSLMHASYFSSSWFPSAGTVGDKTLHMVLITRHRDFEFLPVLAWLPFSLAKDSPAIICLSLTMSFFQSVPNTSMALLQYMDSQCQVAIHISMTQSFTSSRG